MSKIIVTHRGHAHRDDFIACSLLLAGCWGTEIQRRDCTQEDLDDLNTIVVDQGGEYDDSRMNLDHHQMPREAAPCCSISLVLTFVGMEVEFARDVLPWLEFSERIDSKGPFATAAHYKCDPDALLAAMSPIEGVLLRMFGDAEIVRPTDPLGRIMVEVGLAIVDQLREISQRFLLLDEMAVIDVPTPGVVIMDVKSITERPTFGLEQFCKLQYPDVNVTITKDDRGEGYSLFRRNDDPRVDFSRIEGRRGVVFAHKNGFVAKTTADADLRELVLASIVWEKI